MNRQERRRREKELQRQQEFNRQYGAAVRERQTRADDRQLMLWLVCMALGVYDVYGNMPTRIRKLTEAFQRRIYEFGESDLTYHDLVRELKEKTGIEFQWID